MKNDGLLEKWRINPKILEVVSRIPNRSKSVYARQVYAEPHESGEGIWVVSTNGRVINWAYDAEGSLKEPMNLNPIQKETDPIITSPPGFPDWKEALSRFKAWNPLAEEKAAIIDIKYLKWATPLPNHDKFKNILVINNTRGIILQSESGIYSWLISTIRGEVQREGFIRVESAWGIDIKKMLKRHKDLYQRKSLKQET